MDLNSSMDEMSTYATIPMKVRQLLNEIRVLRRQKDVTADPGKATLIQCEIHRKFAIIDWILSLAKKKGGGGAEGDGHWIDLDKIWTLVAAEREEAKATEDDLEAMMIPPSYDDSLSLLKSAAEKREADHFPFYMDLPKLLVRDKILGYLSCPRDKLNVLEAIPSEGQHMGWDKVRTTLLFEAALPILLKHQVPRERSWYPQRPLFDWTDLYNLGRVTPLMRDLIRSDYEQKLDFEELLCNWTSTSLPVLMSDVSDVSSDPDWCRTSPLPFLAHLCFDQTDAVHEEATMTTLKQFGTRVVDCVLDFGMDQHSPQQNLGKLVKILGFIPNVHTLKFNLDKYGYRREEEEGQVNWEWADVECAELPELPCLRAIKLITPSTQSTALSPHAELVKRKLLEMYGAGLRLLAIEGGAGNNVWHSKMKVKCPLLSSVRLQFFYTKLQDVTVQLSMLTESPLKIIHLEVAEPNIRKGFPGLLILFGVHFGGTLEELKLCLESWEDEDNAEGSPVDPCWMTDLKFPQLKLLALDSFPSRSGWTFLLLFPALQKLTLTKFIDPTDEFFEGENILQLSVQRKRMYRSNIWKLLPHLDSYFLDSYFLVPVGTTTRRGFSSKNREFTRQDCIAFQN